MNSNQVNIDDVVNEILGSIPQTQTSVVRLPSLGKMYGLKSPEITVRGMTFDDEKALLNVKNRSQAVDTLISRCVKEDINPRELIPQDKIYIVVVIRALSIGNNYDIKLSCNNCEEESTLTVDVLNTFECRYPEAPLEFIKEIELPSVKKKAKIRLATSNELEQSPQKLYASLSSFVVEIDGRREYAIISKVLEKLPLGDMHTIVKALSNDEIGLDTRFRFKCDHCSYEEETTLSISQDFFMMR